MDIIPSFLSSRTVGAMEHGAYDDSMDNSPLRVGQVSDIIYPSDKKSFTKKFIEYSVTVDHRTNGTIVTKTYEHCVLMNSMAGLADRSNYTLRKAKNSSTEKERLLSNGSLVLILCINGDSNYPIIIGGIKSDHDKEDLKTEKNDHHLHFNFNGIDFFINKDGELKVQYQGKTDDEGKTTVPSTVAGTSLNLLKNGNLVIDTNKQKITIDHANNTIDIVADKAYTVKAKDIKLDASSAFSVTDSDGSSIKGKGLTVGSGSDAFMLGTTYRAAQTQLHTQLMSGLAKMVIAMPLFQMSTAAAGAAEMAAALALFEAKTVTYLSKKNKND